jgi:hypothetical protein
MPVNLATILSDQLARFSSLEEKTMTPSLGKPRAVRVRTRFETVYSAGREDGTGILANISYSGALLTETSLQPRIGSQVRVYVLLSEPFDVVGKVVRHVEGGFALEYAAVSQELGRLIDNAAAIVGEPSGDAQAEERKQ